MGAWPKMEDWQRRSISIKLWEPGWREITYFCVEEWKMKAGKSGRIRRGQFLFVRENRDATNFPITASVKGLKRPLFLEAGQQSLIGLETY